MVTICDNVMHIILSSHHYDNACNCENTEASPTIYPCIINRPLIQMSKRGIRAETSEQHTPVRNGAYERTNKTIVEGALYLLQINYLPLDQEAISVAVHTLNRVITKTAPNTPFQNEYGFKKNLFYVFLDLRGEKWIQRV